ncbi:MULTISPECIES: HlyD family efflux transporter periplasmic adaptor subunit [unclassified Novosphingobium]|uniref:HlyD family efflux transporter periplasmic adaptor subunit n=1 Tax=unclassified Novosphingobium TaxID=2644732 RepID=UPI00146BB878|nr:MULTISPECIES: HlyD family efflux transporter periplasmic adaptor subunit [unclassified Novosphingobium]NMN03010.1 membrane fusion protein (multidrug efflux system) [Novosphingobium sp. SG919]NMN87003.1 membrane fusion protein (multidrug efflux system) [Novosphingobium sp. SG916]
MADIDPKFTGAADSEADADTARKAKRKRGFLLFAGALALVAAGFGLYEWIAGGRYVDTDNAYVAAEVAQVTPLVSGPVRRVAVNDTQVVRRGDILVELDPTDAKIALAAAEADYADALRKVRQTVATGTALSAQVGERQADIARMAAQVQVATADFQRAEIDLKRRQSLVSDGAVSGEELTTARNAYAAAQGQLAAARASLASAQAARGTANGQEAANAALVSGTTPETNPQVLVAKARLDKARIDLARTVIRAPVSGVVTQRNVQVGQSVAVGTVLMTVVPIGQAHVDANFKESQLAHVRPGQPVTLTSDLYGDDVVYHGRVVGFSGGTGSSQAVIPAQNATGNWIKVVQRLPVRVALDPHELGAHPLRIGLSMTATIDTRPEKDQTAQGGN